MGTLRDIDRPREKPHAHVISEASPSFKIGCSDSTIAVGDLIEMLLGISLASKEGMGNLFGIKGRDG